MNIDEQIKVSRESTHFLTSYLVLDLGIDLSHRLQNTINEAVLQFFIICLSVLHFVILPLFKPCIVSKANHGQGGFTCAEMVNITVYKQEALLGCWGSSSS